MAYLALYREWRPQTFKDIIGQEHVTRTLKNAVETGRVGHAYLFCGTRGTGKTTTAKVLAKAVNCLSREGAEPCNRCENCVAVTEGISVDVIEVDAASNRGIDEIRDLREKVRFAPAAGKFRVYIIDEVHMLTSEAFNALLKTLEEPPRHGIFILATTEPHKVPLTILSRCQRFDFRRISPADTMQRLKEVAAGARLEVEEEALRLIARAAEGSLRDALGILDQGAAFGGMRVTAEDVHNILGTVRVDALNKMAAYLSSGQAGPALRLVGELTGEGKDLRLFARELAGFLRALLLEKISPGASVDEAWDDPARMAALAAGFAEDRLLDAVEIVTAAEQEMRWSTMPGIVLEVALVKASKPGARGDLASFAARLADLEENVKKLAAQRNLYGGARPGGEPAKPQKVAPAEKPSPPGIVKEEPAGFRPRRKQAAEPGRPEDPVLLEEIQDSWGDILDALKKERLPLYHNYLRAFPMVMKDGGLVVGFPEGDSLAKDLAELPDNKKYLETLLGRFFKGEWKVAFKFYQGKLRSREKKRSSEEQMADVKRLFGGTEIKLDGENDGTLF
ncbi:MAG TPA: DNA polymerase III subunit gamma/tau [Bacillota bacterium]|nr:DNA polymerase III subunit gamma/tau [Bacillota bacterium]